MKQNDNEHIVFDMLEEVATESIAEVRNEVLFILQKADMICRVGAPRTGRWKLLKQIDFDSK